MIEMNKAREYAELSPCKKRKVGCSVYRDGKLIAYGFNHGYFETCSCSMTEKNAHVLHAEQMAIVGRDEDYHGSTLFVTYAPCEKCAILIVQKKIKTVYYAQADKLQDGLKYLEDHKVGVIQA